MKNGFLIDFVISSLSKIQNPKILNPKILIPKILIPKNQNLKILNP